MSLAIAADGLTVAYGDHVVIDDLHIDFPEGRITTIIGPNGCGKSTLLRAVSRLIPSTGTIRVGGEDAAAMKRRELATKIAVLPQSPTAPPGLVVADLVARGRHPHQSWVSQWSAADEEEVLRALELTGSADLAERSIDELSGGQRQRVWISMVLAQQTEVLFLDEPTTYLDLAHSIDVLDLVRELKETLDRTIIMVLHDLNLAARYSDRLVLMRAGEVRAHGAPADVITPDLLQDAFGLEALVVEDPAVGGPLVVPAASR